MILTCVNIFNRLLSLTTFIEQTDYIDFIYFELVLETYTDDRHQNTFTTNR